MKKIIGYFKNLEGVFFTKDTAGNLREIFSGDPIYSGEVIIDAAGNVILHAMRTTIKDRIDQTEKETNIETDLFEGKNKDAQDSYKSKNPKSTTSTDDIQSNTKEENVDASLRKSGFFTENDGLIRDEFDGEKNIDAPLREYVFGDEFFPEVNFPEKPFEENVDYTQVPTADDAGDPTDIQYTVDDDEGNTSNQATIHVDYTQVLTTSNQTARVSEEGLADGIVDTSGENTGDDMTDSASSAGSMSDDTGLTVTSLTTSAALTSGGESITWAVTGAGTGNATLTGSANGLDVIVMSVDSVGDYTVTLLRPVDHPTNSVEDILDFDVTITVSDGSASSVSTLNVIIEDDMAAIEDHTDTIELSVVNANIQLILDFSGSMKDDIDDGNGGTTTGLAIMQDSVNLMLDQYDNLGWTKVNIVSFNTSASNAGAWMTVADAKAYISALTTDDMKGYTNYDAALIETMDTFGLKGRYEGANVQNVAYFLTDGEPTRSVNWDTRVATTSTATGDGIDAVEQGVWKTFLEANNMNTFVFGMGGSASQVNMNPISYDGSTNTDTDATVVVDVSQLPPILRETVIDPTVGLLNPHVTSGGIAVGIGADGLEATLVLTIDSVTYTYDTNSNTVTTSDGSAVNFDGTTKELSLETDLGGLLIFDLDEATYKYTAAGTNNTTITETVAYTLSDKDGDISGAVLSIEVLPAPVTVEPDIIVVELTQDTENVYEEAIDATGTIQRQQQKL